MTARRAMAFLVAVAMIGGAWFLRRNVIEDADSSPSDSSPSATAAPAVVTANEVVCVPDLKDVCTVALSGRSDVRVVIESVDVTLERRGSDPTADDRVWVTTEPFPAMVDSLRARGRLDPVEVSITPLASSPLVLVVPTARADSLATGCGDPVEWRCLGDAATGGWTDLDPEAAEGTVRPAFAPHPSTATGQLGVTDAFVGFFGGAMIDRSNPALIVWARRLVTTTERAQLGASTAVTQIQVRPSSLDVAVGARAEMIDPSNPSLAVLTPNPAVTVQVVAVATTDAPLPDGVADDLAAVLMNDGWDAPASGGTRTPTADDMLTVRALWEEFT